MPNDIKLQSEAGTHPLDENLRPLKVGHRTAPLELSNTDVRVNNLQVNGTTTGVSASDDTKLPLTGGAMTGAITTNSTFDGVDIATRDGVLTSTTNTANAALPKAGGTMTGDITTDSDIISTNITINDGGSITLDSHTGVFISMKAGTEFSAANSSYAGMILGYTRIQNASATSGHATISLSTTMTVLQTAQGTDVSVTFKAPPSGNVEIQYSSHLYTSSTTVAFALSDNASFNEVGETHTYDSGSYRMDETDTNTIAIAFAVTGLRAGDSYTYYVAVEETSGSNGSIYHGRNRLTGKHYPPIIVRAVALPATITTGE